MQDRNATAAIIGAGDFIGSAIARALRRGGLHDLRGAAHRGQTRAAREEHRSGGRTLRRARPGCAQGRGRHRVPEGSRCDAAPLEVCVFNPGANVNFPILETTERVFRKVWEMACYGGFLTGREAARLMLPHGKGTILFTGATASLRGGIGYAAFASAKFGLRAVAQSMARELGPKNIHVAHLIIDAGVDTAFVRERIKARGGEDALDQLEPDQLMKPESVANAYWYLHSADARRLDVRTRSAALRGDMVMARVEFLFDFGSPNAYLAHQVIPEIEKRTGRDSIMCRCCSGGIFKLTGNRSPMIAFGRHQEQAGIRAARDAPLHRAPQHLSSSSSIRSFPSTRWHIMRGAVAAERAGFLPRYVDAVFHHMWEAPKKMDDPEVIRAALAKSGFDADALLASPADPEVKQRLMDNTENAVARGVFGIPSFFVGDELYFGKDRLRDVEEEIACSTRLH